jgi:hypothetical protein
MATAGFENGIVYEKIMWIGIELSAKHGRGDCIANGVPRGTGSTGELAQKLLLIHVIFEGLVSVDEDNGDFIVELVAKLRVGIDVNFAPGKSAAAREFGEALFHNFAEMASFARVNDDSAGLRHDRDFSACEQRSSSEKLSRNEKKCHDGLESTELVSIGLGSDFYRANAWSFSR